MSLIDPPCNAEEAVQRAQSLVGHGGQYLLGTGDYRPKKVKEKDVDFPWTSNGYEEGSDCAGFAICWTWKLRRSRLGFNVGAWASVESAINCNSALEDGVHKQELFTTLAAGAKVQAGDLLLYPTHRAKVDGKVLTWIGHVALIELVPGDFVWGDWRKLTVLQCHGPNHYKPGVVRTDGMIWAHHDLTWEKEEHRTHVVRPKTRT